MFNYNKFKKGFSLVELIVVMGIMAILVLVGVPKFLGHTKQAKMTTIKANIKELEGAADRYYLKTGEWPRATDIPYTAEELETYTTEILNRTGKTIILDPEGNYYSIDYVKLKNYVKKPNDDFHYIIQNPIGEVFYLDNLNENGKVVLGADRDGYVKDDESSNPYIKTSPIFHLSKNITNNKWIDNVNGLIGTMHNFDSSSITDKGLQFDGIDDYVDFGDVMDMGINDFSISMWLKTDMTPTSAAVILSKSIATTSNYRYSFDLISTGAIRGFMQGNNSYNDILPIGKKILNDNQWHLITINFDRASYLTVYIDGEEDERASIAHWKNVDFDSSNPFRIGAYTANNNTTAANYFKGEIADVAIYNKLLTASDIKEIYDYNKIN